LRRAIVDLTDEQILERLLALNQERAAKEASAQTPLAKNRSSRQKTEDELVQSRGP